MGLAASHSAGSVAVSLRGVPACEAYEKTGKELILHPKLASGLHDCEYQEEQIRALHLPEHLFRIILLRLVRLDEPRSSVQSILSLSATCAWLRALCMEPEIWQELCIRHFQAPRNLPVSWYELYRYNHEAFNSICDSARPARSYGPQGIGNGRALDLQA